MKKDQRDILIGLLDAADDLHGYEILTIEYPCAIHGEMKVVTRQYDPNERKKFIYVDVYGVDGRTISTESRLVP